MQVSTVMPCIETNMESEVQFEENTAIRHRFAIELPPREGLTAFRKVRVQLGFVDGAIF
jgi:hypothetical protein